MLVNASPTAGIRRERLSATFGQVGRLKHFTADLPDRSSRYRSACGRIPRPERRTATKNRRAIFGYDPEQFPYKYCETPMQCGCHEFHQISERKSSFL